MAPRPGKQLNPQQSTPDHPSQKDIEGYIERVEMERFGGAGMSRDEYLELLTFERGTQHRKAYTERTQNPRPTTQTSIERSRKTTKGSPVNQVREHPSNFKNKST